MRSALLALVLLGCSLGPPPSIHAPRAPGCGTLAQGIVGIWGRDRGAMEIRPDGSMLRDGLEGAFRWTAPSHATIDVAGAHEDHTYGLMTGLLMLDVDASGRSILWTRLTPAPGYPASCFAIGGSLVGDWSDGAVTESFHADGTYARGGAEGRWVLAEPGYLDVTIAGRAARRYRVALAAPDTLVSAFDGVVTDEDPRGPSLVERRVR